MKCAVTIYAVIPLKAKIYYQRFVITWFSPFRFQFIEDVWVPSQQWES